MNVLYEENGTFKAGTVMDELPGSFMVEGVSGRRLKIKKNHVYLTFKTPSARDILVEAETYLNELDIDFLWECAPESEFHFQDFAAEYFGESPSAAQMAAILLKIHAMPMYFCRKGTGQFKKAQEDNLKAALAGMEKKRKAQEAIQQMVDSMQTGVLPEEMRSHVRALLYKPDKNSIFYKALEEICKIKHTTPPKLLHELGAIPSHYDYHLNRFLFEHFASGIAFDEVAPMPVNAEDLPLGNAQPFSMDDEQTVEIDDALSAAWLDDTHVRVGVHIAVPTLLFSPDDEIDVQVRKRMSTVYMPGDRITMMPEAIVQPSTLFENMVLPTLSYYVDFEYDTETGRFNLQDGYTVLERLKISENKSNSAVETTLDELAAQELTPEDIRKDPLTTLYAVSQSLLKGRAEKLGKAPQNDQTDYTFFVEDGRVRIVERRRGSPLDTLVAEMMILVNNRWAKWLAETNTAAIYRTQSPGKVALTTMPGEHTALGLDYYAWASAPIRRYVDLVNQWQLVALAKGATPPFQQNDPRLFEIIQQFDYQYTAYNEFQNAIEQYWSMRWLEQENIQQIPAVVVKDQIARLEGLPLTVKTKTLPLGITGQRVLLQIESIDFWEPSVTVRYVSDLPKSEKEAEEPAVEA